MRLGFFFLALATSLTAAPVGNTSFPELICEGFFIPSGFCVNARAGYEGDFVGDGRFKQVVEGSGRVDDYQQETNSGTVTLNVMKRLDVYGVLGSSRASADWRYSLSGTVNRIMMQSRYRFLWGCGARGILYRWGCMDLGLGTRYEATEAKLAWLTLNGTPVSTSGSKLAWHIWQADLDVCYKIDLFIPYIGLKYSSAHAKIGRLPVSISGSGSGTLHMENRAPVGVVVGCSVCTGKYFMFNVEGRLIDEEAAAISGDLKF